MTKIARMGFKDLFSSHAATYLKYRPEYPREIFELVANLTSRRGLVWDCGTGNGQAAVALAEFFQRVIATDASSQQIEHARPHPRVEYRVAPAEASGLEPESVDVVTVAQAIHWFPFDAFYAEVNRVLRPDGFLVIWCYGISRIEPAIDALVDELYEGVLGTYWDERRRHIDSGLKSLPFPFDEQKTPPLALVCDWSVEQYVGYMDSWSAMQAFRQKNPGVPDPLQVTAKKLAALWKGNKKVVWPMSVKVGKKRKP